MGTSTTYPMWQPVGLSDDFVHKASEEAEIGDLLYFDSVNHCVRSAANVTDAGSTTTPENFATSFVGVGNSKHLSTDAAVGSPARVFYDAIWEFPCVSNTFEPGDYVKCAYDAGNSVLFNQKLDKTTDALAAIGRVIKEYTSATTIVKVRLTSRTIAGIKTVAGTGSLTADQITGSDSSLGITGQAGSSSAGGIVAIAGGAGDTASAGGAVTVTGGAGNTSGAGGALTLAAGAGGSSGNGGNASLAGGAGTGAGTAGTLTLVAGAGGATNVAGGASSLTGGAGGGTGNGGAVTVVGGASGTGASGVGGAVSVTGGANNNATNGTGGAASLVGGVAKGTGTGGAATITSGASGGSSGTAGAVNIDAGSAATGTAGNVLIADVNAGATYLNRGALKSLQVAMTLTAVGTAQTSTLTAAQLLGGLISQSSTTAGGAVNLPTGTALSTGCPRTPVAGDTFEVDFYNVGTQTLTITGTTGTTVIGTSTVGTNKNIRLRFYLVSANVWSIYSTLSA